MAMTLVVEVKRPQTSHEELQSQGLTSWPDNGVKSYYFNKDPDGYKLKLSA